MNDISKSCFQVNFDLHIPSDIYKSYILNLIFTTQYLDEKATIIKSNYLWILIRNILLQISSLLRNHSYFTLDSDFDGMWIYWKVHLHSFLYDSLIFDFTTIAKDRPCLKTTCWIGIAGFKDNSEIIGNFRIFKNFQAIEPRNRKKKSWILYME